MVGLHGSFRLALCASPFPAVKILPSSSSSPLLSYTMWWACTRYQEKEKGHCSAALDFAEGVTKGETSEVERGYELPDGKVITLHNEISDALRP